MGVVDKLTEHMRRRSGREEAAPEEEMSPNDAPNVDSQPSKDAKSNLFPRRFFRRHSTDLESDSDKEEKLQPAAVAVPLVVGTILSTSFGIATITNIQNDTIEAQLQWTKDGMPPALFMSHKAASQCQDLPVVLHENVSTSQGDGIVLHYDRQTNEYVVEIVSDKIRVPPSDVKRKVQPRLRRASQVAASVLQRGVSNAYKTVVSTSTSISHYVSDRSAAGSCVLTTHGPAIVVSLDSNQGKGEVEWADGTTSFIEIESIQHYVKAIPGMQVTSKFGTGVVDSVRPEDGIYTVRLDDVQSGESDLVFVPEMDLMRLQPRRSSSENANVLKRLRSFTQSRNVDEKDICTAGI